MFKTVESILRNIPEQFRRNLHLAYCPLYKAASSSWLTVFSVINNVSVEYIETSGKQLSDIARSVVPSLGGPEAVKVSTKYKSSQL